MRHLEQILADKKENDALLEKATKRATEILVELEALQLAVHSALNK